MCIFATGENKGSHQCLHCYGFESDLQIKKQPPYGDCFPFLARRTEKDILFLLIFLPEHLSYIFCKPHDQLLTNYSLRFIPLFHSFGITAVRIVDPLYNSFPVLTKLFIG